MTTLPTYQVQIFMAGDFVTAGRVLREFCYQAGACFTITPTKFFYTGGEEDGFFVGLVNYPRFPSDVELIDARALALAEKLLAACNQRTCLLVGTSETRWLVVEPPGTQ